MLRVPANRLSALAVLALLAAAVGCKATADDIEEWKFTVKGPGKIVAVLLSENYDLDLRTTAAVALVEMAPRTSPERLDPLAELQRAIQRLDDGTRTTIIDSMVPRLEGLLEGGGNTEGGPPSEQVRAKDAAYLLIAHAEDESRDRLVEAVIGWYVQDFNGRNLAGNYSAQQVVESLGSPAARRLVNALRPESEPLLDMRQQALVKLAELIGQLGDDESKSQAGERLVAIEQHMESDEFLEALAEKIRESMREQLAERVADLGVRYAVDDDKLIIAEVPEDSPAGEAGLQRADILLAVDDTEITDPMAAINELLSGPEDSQVRIRYKRGETTGTATVTRDLDQKRVMDTAIRNRNLFVLDGALNAMKHLNDVPAVTTRLLAIAEDSEREEEVRRRALMAMEGGAEEEHMERLLAVALDPEVPSSVKDYAFDRVGDIRSAAAIPRMWGLLEEASYENEGQRLRWRAGEMILLIGGPAIVQEFLSRLPSEEGVKFEPAELEGYAQRLSQMSPPPTDRMRRELSSSRWWNQVIALRYFERKGEESDLASLQRVTRNRTVLAGDGWGRRELETVGDVAEDAISSFRERLSGEAGEDEGGSGEQGDEEGQDGGSQE